MRNNIIIAIFLAAWVTLLLYLYSMAITAKASCNSLLSSDGLQESSLQACNNTFKDDDVKARMCRVTAYCPCKECCGKFADGITASGHKIQAGDRFVAANASIPFGRMVVVPGYNNGKPVPVLDRGGAIKGDKIDVFFGSHAEALEWGVKCLEVKFLEVK